MITYDFTHKVALITGGASGIGLAIAHAFASAGARVVIAARSERAGHAACDALGPDALFVATDVRDEVSVAQLLQRTLAHFGRLDFAFNCAGAGGDMAPLEHTDQRVWTT